VRKTDIRQKLKSSGGSNMLKRFYLFLTLFTALSLSVVLTSAFADQRARAKDRGQNRDGQAKVEGEAAQVFTVPAPGGNSSYLGVYLEEVAPDRVKELGLAEERGALITKVVEGSPADKAGLKRTM
jgi:S1-C subfamily serine protease